MPTRSVIAAAVLALAGLTLAACGSDDTSDATATASSTSTAAGEEATTTTAEQATTTMAAATTTTAPTVEDIASLVGGDPAFVQLAIMLSSAGLTDTLKGTGPFTVFAPTNDAFVAVGADTLNALNSDPAQSTPILTYHVVPGALTTADLTTGKLTTVNGAELDVVVDGDNVTVNGAKVVKADVPAANGVVHVIDAVLLPPQA